MNVHHTIPYHTKARSSHRLWQTVCYSLWQSLLKLKYWKIRNPFCALKLINRNRFGNLRSRFAAEYCTSIYAYHMNDINGANSITSCEIRFSHFIVLFVELSAFAVFFFSIFYMGAFGVCSRVYEYLVYHGSVAFVDFNLMFSPHLSKCSRV